MQPVLDYLATHEGRFLSELCAYLRFPSVSAQPRHKPDLEKCATWIADHCRALGLNVEVCPTAGNPIVLAVCIICSDAVMRTFVRSGAAPTKVTRPLTERPASSVISWNRIAPKT